MNRRHRRTTFGKSVALPELGCSLRALAAVARRSVWRQPLMALVLVCLIVSPQHAALAQDSFRLGTGDKLRITVFQEPELSGEYSVSSSGIVSIPLIGGIKASGLTTRALERAIVAALADGLIQDPKVSVEVLEARPFYILGDVTAPGSYPYVSGMTVLNAIALAGGNLVTEEDEIEARLALVQDQERLALLIKEYRSAVAFESRLIAQRDGMDRIEFPSELLAAGDDPEVQAIMNGEGRVFQSEQKLLASRLELLTEKSTRIEEQISAFNAQVGAVQEQMSLINEQLRDQNELFEKGLARSTQVADLKRDIAAAKIARAQLLVDIARARQALSESRLGMVEVRNEALRTATLGLQSVQKDLSRLRTSIHSAREEVRQNRVRLGRTRAALSSDQGQKAIITRRQGNRVVELEANDETAIAPGDIVRIVTDVEAPLIVSDLLAPDTPIDLRGIEAQPIAPSIDPPAGEEDLPSVPSRGGADTPATAPAVVAAAPPEATISDTPAASDAGSDAATSAPNSSDSQQSDSVAETAPSEPGIMLPPTQTAEAAEDVVTAPTSDPQVQATASAAPSSETTAVAEAASDGDAPVVPATNGDAEQEAIEAAAAEEAPPASQPVEEPAPTPAQSLAQRVTDVQTLLKSLGYGESPRIVIDGLMGPRTRGAIQAFQRNHNLEPDGQPSESLLRRLTEVQDQLGGGKDPRIEEAAARENRPVEDNPAEASQQAERQPTEEPSSSPESNAAPEAGQEGDEPQVAAIATRTIWLGDDSLTVNQELVREIKQNLIELGYDERVDITADASLDSQTRTAIVLYQRDVGLAETGQPTPDLLAHMKSRINDDEPAQAPRVFRNNGVSR